jgi:ribosome biogenesis GTPase / thiamine phosphate phosphatase
MDHVPPLTGTIVRVDSRQCEVLPDGQEKVQPALMRGKLFGERSNDKSPVAVGDRVDLEETDLGFSVEAVHPRRNLFSRRAAGGDTRRQPLAANVDQVVLVACFGTPPFSSLMTDRILAATSFAGIPAFLVLNKVDKAKRKKIERVAATYREINQPLLLTSAATGEGVDELRDLLAGKLSVFYGLSGVGKSSLLNLIEDGLGIRTREVSSSLKSGRHTTTYARRYPLQAGGAVIDTPGVRSFKPYGIPPKELRLHFPEMAAIATECQFHSCYHRGEPGCCIPTAIDEGRVFESRYRAYVAILTELEEEYGAIR